MGPVFNRTTTQFRGLPQALAMAPLGNDMIAILAGDDRTKAISLVSLSSGALLRTFGVTREATDLSTAGPNGPLLITIGGTTPDGHVMGAVETWSLDGVKQARRADAIARRQHHACDRQPRLRAGRVRNRPRCDSARYPKPDRTKGDPAGRGLARTRAVPDRDDHVLGVQPDDDQRRYRDGRGARPAHGRHDAQHVVADDPTCIDGSPGIYAIEKSLVNDKIAILDVPGLQEQRNLSAEGDTAVLNESFDHRLLALDITGRVSTVEEYPPEQIGPLGQLR